MELHKRLFQRRNFVRLSERVLAFGVASIQDADLCRSDFGAAGLQGRGVVRT